MNEIFKKLFIFFKFSTALLTHSLTNSLIHSLTHSLTRSLAHSLTRSFTHSLTHSRRELITTTALLLWWKCLEFCGKKPLIILNAYVYVLFSYNITSLWCSLLLSTATIKGYTRLPASH